MSSTPPPPPPYPPRPYAFMVFFTGGYFPSHCNPIKYVASIINFAKFASALNSSKLNGRRIIFFLFFFFGNFCHDIINISFYVFFSISISPNLYIITLNNYDDHINIQGVLTLICVGKHNICVGNCEIILIGNREIKRPRICHDFKTRRSFNSREFNRGVFPQ